MPMCCTLEHGLGGVLIFTLLNQILFWADNDIMLSYLRCALEIEP
jgi:hypothetical protein